MTDQELDALMKRVLVDSMKLDLEADTKDNTAFFNPSSRYQRQMRAMLKDPLGWAKKKARPKWKNIALEAAMILLVISLGFGAVMVSSPTARAAFARWIEELYETYIIYRYSGDSTSGEMPRYEITELPEGFAERDRIELSRTTSVTYANEAENVIYFGYSIMVQGGAIVYDDIDNSDVYDIKVNQMSGQFFESRSPEKFNTIIWIDTKNNIQFDISGVYDYTVSVKSSSVNERRVQISPDAAQCIKNQSVLHFVGAFQGSNSWTFSDWPRPISAAEAISQDK